MTIGPVSWGRGGYRINWLHLCWGVRLSQQVSYGPVNWSCRKHRLHLCRGMKLPQRISCGPVYWGCRKHQLLLCRGVRLPQQVSYRPVYWGCRKHQLLLCHRYTLIRNYNQHKHKHTSTHLQLHIRNHTKSQQFFYSIFSIFDSFHFLNCLMIIVLQKLHETQGSQSTFPWIKYIYI